MLKKIFVSILIFGFLSLSHSLSAKIVETCYFDDIFAEIDQQTLVLVDIDDTLINTTSMLGNTSWWNYFVSKIKNAHLPLEVVRPDINEVIRKILFNVPMGLIESHIANSIKKLQTQGISVFALTGRSMKADYLNRPDLFTHETLNNLGIDFAITSVPEYHDAKTCPFFSYGIIFTDHQNKGPFLKEFLSSMDFCPKKVVFIDDNLIQMKSVEDTLALMGIPFVGFRYGRLDKIHRSFDPLLVNIQLEALIKDDLVLSDEEAVKVAQENSYSNPDYFMDELIHYWLSLHN